MVLDAFLAFALQTSKVGITSVNVTDRATSHSRAQVVPHQPSHWLLRARRGRDLFSGLLRTPQMRGRGVSGI